LAGRQLWQARPERLDFDAHPRERNSRRRIISLLFPKNINPITPHTHISPLSPLRRLRTTDAGALIQLHFLPAPRYPQKFSANRPHGCCTYPPRPNTARRIDTSLTPCPSNLLPSRAHTRKPTFPTVPLSHQVQCLAPGLLTPTKVACNRSAMPACFA